MTWILQWKHISTKMMRLQEISRSYFDSINTYGVDHYGIGGSQIIPAARDLFNEVLELRKNFANLPSEVSMLIGKLEKSFGGHKFTGIPGAGGALVILGIFNTEMNSYLKDHEIIVKDRVRLAFLHLQRTLFVDSELRRKWFAAFQEGDVALEKLGAVHLLTHGLWAFKPRNSADRVDLVLGNPINADEVEQVGASLILTEWKKVTGETLAEKSKEALAHARKYGLGLLPGTELKREKYLIMVSESSIDMPHTVMDGDIRYIFVNLAVNQVRLELPTRIKEGFTEEQAKTV